MKRNTKALLIVLIMIMCVTSLFLVSCGKKYTVTLNSNGTTTQEEVAEGETFALQTPTLENHEFAGWYLSQDFSGEPVTEIVVNADVNVYAKWERLYNVTLNLEGGTLANTKIQLKDGENVYNAVKDLVPTKTNAKFDAWKDGNYAINSSMVVNGADITLTASYKYAYTIEIYQQNLAGDGYEKAAEDVVDYEYAGVTLTPEFPLVAGFEPAENHPDAVPSKTISENASQNVFKLYFNRKTITITFQIDYPNNSHDDNINFTVIYGNEVTVPTDITYKGYYLFAWENLNGSVTHLTNTIQAETGDENAKPTTFVPTESETFYPVWIEGYTNMFGGSDYIFLLEDDAEVCYLARGDVYFVGTYYAEDGSFEFKMGEWDTLYGQISKEYDAYFFLDDSRMEKVYSYTGREFKQNIVLTFGSGNDVQYEITDEETTATFTSKGTYRIVNNEYIITFTTGEFAGQVKHAIIGTLNTTAGKTKVYMFRNETEYETMSKLVRFVMTESGMDYYRDTQTMHMDGYGNLTYVTADGNSTYYYTLKSAEDNTYNLINRADGKVAAIIKIFEQKIGGGDVIGYMVYNNTIDQVFYAEDGSTLELDGYYTAIYTDGNKNQTVATYNMEQTRLTNMIRFFDKSATRNFSIGVEQKFGEVSYFFEEKLATYAEYLYMSNGSLYYAPLIVLDATKAGEARIYGYNTNGTFTLVSEGTYSVDKATGLYTYVETKAYEYTAGEVDQNNTIITPGVLNTPVDYSILKSVVFKIDTTTFTYESTCWYSYTDDENVKHDNVKTYTCNKEGVTHTLVGYNNMLFTYTDENGTYEGFLYQQQDDIIVIAIKVNGNYSVLPVKLSDDGTFQIYTQLPFTAKELLANGTESQKTSMKFDGLNTWTYIDGTGEETYVYVGTATKTGNKSQISNLDIYLFEGEANTSDKETSFEFILISVSGTYYIAKYNHDINGVYREKEGEGSLMLDGYSYQAEYIKDAVSQTQVANYLIEGDAIRLYVSGGSIYLDLDLVNKTYTVRGEEAGTYLIVDNLSVSDYIIRLNGYGKLIASKTVENADGEYETVEVDANGTYQLSNNRVIISFKDGARTFNYEGKLGTYSTSSASYYAFIVYHAELNVRLINDDDMSVLIIDAYGATTRILSNGAQETGYTALITEDLLYYYNDAGDYACIYKYDLDAGTAVASDYTRRGYYSESLDSLLFTEYGFAIFGGTERLYYSVDNGEVTIYRHDPENTKANKYGYVEGSFGRFALEITYEGKKYYQTSGYDLTFTREKDTEKKFPVTIEGKKYDLQTLSFVPGGSVEYAVNGVITINGKNYQCVVGCEYNEKTEKYETYISLGMIKFTIDVTFNGEDDASYNITSMRMDVTAYSANVIYNDYVYSMFLGMRYPDNMGTITLYGTYDVNGELVESYVSTNFIEESNILDRNGDLMQVEQAEFTSAGNNRYVVIFTAGDGYQYRMDFTIAASNYANAYEYNLYSISRIQTIVTDNGYTVRVGRTVASNISVEIGNSYSAGFICFVEAEKDGKVYNFSTISGDKLSTIAIYRELEEHTNKIVNSLYFNFRFEEESEEATVKLFKSCELLVEEVETIYAENGIDYIDVRKELGKVSYFHYTQYDQDGNAISRTYATSDSMYDKDTDIYFLEVSSTLLVAIVSTDSKGNKTVVLDIAVIVKDGDNSLYFTYYDQTFRFIKYNDKFYRPEEANSGYDELSKTYLFSDGDKKFVVTTTKLASGETAYSLHEVRYVYAADGINFIAIDVNTNEVIVVKYANRIKVATSSTYNEATNTYSVVTDTGALTAKVTDGKVEITD